MQTFSPFLERLSRVRLLIRMLALTVIASFIAIFAFNVALSTVAAYALFALFCGSHLFMHGSHGGQQHTNHASSNSSPQALSEKATSTEDHADHSKGCH